ncbi:MAG: hypothetical protein WC263_03025 [Candidatus Micrarchaeia archaeon]|jgi:hypothetical protein
MLSFLPAGRARGAAEHLIAAIVGALLIFIFFMVSEAAVQLMKDTPLMSITFVPVICLLPVLAGALAVIVFERLRRSQPGMKRGALVGGLAGFFGASASAVPLIALAVLNKNPLGDMLSSSLLVVLVMLATICLDTLLAAAGGAIVVKFTS